MVSSLVYINFFFSRKTDDEKIGALWHRIGNYQTDIFQFGMIDSSGECYFGPDLALHVDSVCCWFSPCCDGFFPEQVFVPNKTAHKVL